MANSAEIARRNRAETAQQGPPPRKVYNLHRTQYSSTTDPPPPSGRSTGGGGRSRLYINVQNKQAPIRPRFMGSQRTIIFAWIVAMIFVVADEWKRFGILPRPSRLWWTTLVYGILALLSQLEALIPLTNALALGYSITVAWQFFNKEGQFSG